MFLTKPKMLIASSFSSLAHLANETAREHTRKVADFFKTKNRHTICSRSHHFIPAGVVDHLIRPEISACTSIKSHFCFCPEFTSATEDVLLPVPGKTAMVERSCYECSSCFILDKSNCKLSKYTGKPQIRKFDVQASNGTGLVAARKRREVALMARLATKVKTDVNVVVCIKEESGKYTWRIAKAVGKPRPAKAGERDHDGVSFGASKSKGILVVDVHQYDVIKRNLSEYGTYGEALDAFENDPQSVAVCLRSPMGMCSKKWNLCGTVVGCMKQHKLTYRLSDIREPCGFKMATLTQAATRAARQANKHAPFSYFISTGLLQQISQNIGALDVA